MLVIEQIHKQLTNAATDKRDEALNAIGHSSPKVFYQIIQGKRPASKAEQEAFAKIYGKPAEELFKPVPKKPGKSKRKPVK